MFQIIAQLNTGINQVYQYQCSVNFLQSLEDKIFGNTNLFLMCWNQHYKNELPEHKFRQKMMEFLNQQLLNTSVQTFQQY
jgi:hypothetical protein